MNEYRTKTRRLRGGMFAVGRAGPTASRFVTSFAPKAATAMKVGPGATAGMLAPGTAALMGRQFAPATGLLNPQQRMAMSSAADAAAFKYPVVGVASAKAKSEAPAATKSPTKVSMYSTKTFPKLEKYTAQQILMIEPRYLASCYQKAFDKEPPFSYKTQEEFLKYFFADLKEAGRLEKEGDGIVRDLISKKVDTSPDATLNEGFQVTGALVPTTSKMAEIASEAAKNAPPEQVYPPALVQQANLFIETTPSLINVQHFFIGKNNITNVTMRLGYQPSAEVFRKANEDIHRVAYAAFADGFDPKAFNKLFSESRLQALKAGLLNYWAKGDKQDSFANFQYVLLCVKYEVFTEASLDSYLSTLLSKPEDAYKEIKTLFDDYKKFEKKKIEEPILTGLKSKVWHFYKYFSQVKWAAALGLLVVIAAMFGIYSFYDLQRALHVKSQELEVEKEVNRTLLEIQLAGKSIQAKAIEPAIAVLEPVTAPVAKGYKEFTAEERRKQYLFYRMYDAMMNKLSSKKGGVRQTRKLTH